jgi:hypothetical protein
VPARSGVTELVVFRTDEVGRLVGMHHRALEGGSAPTQCLDVQLSSSQPTDLAARVQYRSLHGSPRGPAAIEWAAVFTGESLELRERLPVRLITAGGGQDVSKSIRSRYLSDGGMELWADGGDRRLRYGCGRECIVPVELLLEGPW